MKQKSFGICPFRRNESGEIEILMSRGGPKEGWGFFKGKSESGETPPETALREFHEEAGIQLERGILDAYYEQKNKHKDIGIFLANFMEKEVTVVPKHDEVYEYQWQDINDIIFGKLNLARNQAKIIHDVVKKLVDTL